MSLDEIWASPWNTPSPLDRQRFVDEALALVRRAQRRRAAFLASTLAALAATTAGGGYLALTAPSQVAGLPLLALLIAAQWAVCLLVLRQWWGARAQAAAPGATIRESLERLRQESERSRRRQVAVLALFAVAVPLLAGALVQLRAAGKMAPHEAASAGALFAVLLAGNAGALLWRRYRVLLPRRRRLEELLRQYGEG